MRDSNPETGTLKLDQLELVYRIYRPVKPENCSPRRLLLIHGAGVAGRYTWEGLARFLTEWDEILVPDLRGAGETHWVDREERPFTVEELVDDIEKLIRSLQWQTFDLGGYSLGGLVAMLLKQRLRDRVQKQYLLESAILDRESWQDTVAIRETYASAAAQLHHSKAEEGIKTFLDAISPNRRVSPQVEKLTIARLGERARGFAYSLQSVNQAIKQLDRETVLAAQGDVSSFIGGLSVDLMHQLHRALADRLPNWHYFLISGTDHSLPYQKPRQIAHMMNEELRRYLSR